MDSEFLKSEVDDQQMELMLMMGFNYNQENNYKDRTFYGVLDDYHANSPALTNDTSFSGEQSGPPLSHPAAEKWRRNPSTAEMREMIFRIAAMQPIHIDSESIKPPRRKNVRISTDPQSVAARHRRERISERIRILQRLVPGGTKMDTASMLDEAIHYVKFLKNQVRSLEGVEANRPSGGLPVPMAGGGYFPVAAKAYHRSDS